METQIEASFCAALRIAREQKSISLVKSAEATYAEYCPLWPAESPGSVTFIPWRSNLGKVTGAPQAGSVIRVNSRKCWMSRTGGSPKWRLYSRLKCEASS
jgi:hypothetical protein